MLRKLMAALVDILWPKTCLACRVRLKNRASVDNFICSDCWMKIKRNLPPFCYRCGRHIERANATKNICPSCIRKPLHFDRAFSPCLYEGVLKGLIHEFKYKNKDYLGPTLSKLMTEFIAEYSLPMDLIDSIIPMPLHKTRLREREFNQAEVLSRHIAGEFNKPVLNDVLKRPRHTKTQTGLEEEQRFLNVKDSFVVTNKENVAGKKLLLVDDVLTTAATSSEAAYTLKKAGANIVFVLTLAN